MDLPEGDPRRLTREEADRLNREQVGDIPVPPKYTSADFRKGEWWRLRGKLDVPKERFILYPGAERAGDATPVVGWAGWDHLQQAQAALAPAPSAARSRCSGWRVDRYKDFLNER